MSIRRELEEKLANYIDAFNHRGDVAGPCSMNYTDDATYLFPRHKAVRGRYAIKALQNDIFKAGTRLVRIELQEVVQDGDLAFATFTYATEQETGKALEVLKRQADGKWKTHVESISAD